MNDKVRILVPHDQITAIELLIDDLAADLELPSGFVIAEGSPGIADHALLVRKDDDLAEVLFNNRVHLITDAIATRIAREQTGALEPPPGFAQLLRELVRNGVKLGRAMRVSGTPLSPVETFEAALEDASARITLRVSDKMAQFLSNSRVGTNGADWSQQLTLMNDAVYEELGLPHRLAEIVIDETVPFPALRPQINDMRCPVVRGLDPDEFLVNDTVERLRLLNVEGRRATNPANGNDAAIIHGRKVAEICEQAGLTVLDTGGFALQVLRSRIRRHAGSLMPLSIADLAFRRLSIAFPATARRAEEVFALIDRTRILRCLLREGISIRNLLQISEALVRLGPPLDIDFSKLIVFNFPGIDAARPPLASEVQSLADGVRMALKRQLTYFYTSRTSTLVVHSLDPEIVAGFMSGAAPSFVEAFRRSVWSKLNDRAWGVPPKVILTSATIRAQCAELIAADLPDVAVVSYSELAPDINISSIGMIELD